MNGAPDDFELLPPSLSPKEEHYISENVPVADGLPVFSENYFNSVNTGKISTYKLINSCILRPEIERLASKFTNAELNRGKKEAEVIKACRHVPELVALLKSGIDNLNNVLMRDRLLEKPEEAVSLLLIELQGEVSEIFVEFSVRTIGIAKIDVAGDLMRIIGKNEKSVYQLSLLCLLLGFQKNPAIPQFLWNYYRFFKTRYPDNNYWQGPFFGLWENWASMTFDGDKG